MGKEAINVSSVDADKLLEMLNAALSEEWLAYYSVLDWSQANGRSDEE